MSTQVLRPEEQSPPRLSPWSLTLAQVVLGLGFAVVLARYVLLLMPTQRAYFLQEAEARRAYYEVIHWPRGEIVDRNGHLLAGVAERYQVDVRVREIQDWPQFAQRVAPVLGKEPQEVLDLLAKAASPVVLLDPEISAAQRDLLEDVPGLVFTPRPARVYPEGSLAANVLGFVAPGNRRGFFGVEQYYDEILQPPDERVQRVWDPFAAEQAQLPSYHRRLVLTLNIALQAEVEALLDQSVEDTKAEGGVVVVLEPYTGAILAMASNPRPDLSDYQKLIAFQQQGIPYNWAVGSAYEPGSVFKVLVMGMALNEGVVQPDTEYIDLGVEDGGNGTKVYNWNRGAWGRQTMVGCLEYSLNTCLAWVAKQIPDDRFYAYLRAFGFGQYTGVDLADEVPGFYRDPTNPQVWSRADKIRQGFGQAIAVTPLQMAVAAAAIANGGYLVQPYVVAEVDLDGYVYPHTPEVVRQVLPREVTQTLTEMLVQSLQGESSKALVPGYQVAGKTGTAEIIGPQGPTGWTNASFVGWLPADEPRAVIYVWLHKPKTSIWASEVATPLFRLVAERVMMHLGVPPDPLRPQQQAAAGQP